MSFQERKRVPAEVQRKRILGAALNLFAGSGLTVTTISSIAKEAGISHGLVHHYFETKEHLFASVIDEVLNLFQDVRSTAVNARIESDEVLKRWIYIMTLGIGQESVFTLFSRLVMQILGSPSMYGSELVDRIHTFCECEVAVLEQCLIEHGRPSSKAADQACLAFNTLIGAQMFGMRQIQHLRLLYKTGCQILEVNDPTIPEDVFMPAIPWVITQNS